MSTENKSELLREKTFVVKGNKYVVKFPTIGQFLDIEARRMELSSGTYSLMLKSALISSQTALDMIDMAAQLSVLCPDVIKDLKASSLLDLDIIDGRELLESYNEQLRPWMNEWMTLLRNPPKMVKKEPEQKSDTGGE